MTEPNKKAAAAAGRAASQKISAGSNSTTSTLPYWLASLSTTAVYVVSLAAPTLAALSGLIEGGRQ